ncbi:MAG: aldo/keto reductase [Verrucomicrobiaceae bacterium]|nr:MAG: aldo/keto reductase [Verrucomicrobiaceae bacterium]
MDLTRTVYGTWSGGRFMHFGEVLEETRFIQAIQLAYESGIRTFITADVYGGGRADELLGQALTGIDRSSYCLVGSVGHDFYDGIRDGSKGYPRFTDPALRGPEGYADFLKTATEKSLARCRTGHFDLLMLHNPDERGYTSDAVWEGMRSLKTQGLARQLGVAPGPANGFTYDLIQCFESYCELIDWAMIILNPLEPWPGSLALPAADEFGVKLLTRVVDYGGLFHGDIKPGHTFRPGDHRSFRPAGWVERGLEKVAKMKPIADKHDLSLLQFACLWNLAHSAVESVVPTFIQEAGENSRTIEDQIRDMASLPVGNPLTAEEVAEVARIGDNTGCMTLKGASRRHTSSDRPDEWAMRQDLEPLGKRWGLESIQ